MRKLWLGIALVVGVGAAGWWALRPPPAPAPVPKATMEVVPQANCGLTLERGAALGVYTGALPGGGEVDLHVHRSRGVSAPPVALANTPLVAFARIGLGDLGALFGGGAGPTSPVMLCATTVGPGGEPRAGVLTEPDPFHRTAALTLYAPLDAPTADAVAALGGLDSVSRPARKGGGAYVSLQLGEPGPSGDRALLTRDGRVTGPAVLTFVDGAGHGRTVDVTLR